MKTHLFPLDDVFTTLASALSRTTFAPASTATFGETIDARPVRAHAGFWDWLDRYAWKQFQKEREAYLARAENLADLENRIRQLDSGRVRFY